MINVQDLHFTYPDGRQALTAVNLTIQPGERLALIGGNGSGKSTLALCLNGLLKPVKGTVSVESHCTTDPSVQQTLRRLVGLVFQYPDDQLVAASVEAEIAFGLENQALPPAQIAARVEEVLALFDLARYRHHPPHLLSGGERQRLAVAAVVALQPRYLILDEPTALLDPPARQRLEALLADLRADLGLGLLVITQDPDEATQADRVLVLDQGRLVRDAAPHILFQEHPFLAATGLAAPLPYILADALSLPTNTPYSLSSLAAQLACKIVPVPPYPMADDDAPIKLSTAGLHYSHADTPAGQAPALEDITVAIGQGQATALIGVSGAGKTTLAQHFNGLLRPQAGQVLVDGVALGPGEKQLVAIRRRVGLVFQFPEFQLFESTVALDVAFGLRPLGLHPSQVTARVRQALDQVGLDYERFAHRPPLGLSGGEKRRVALAGVLAMQPEVLVLDEPTAGLDPRGVKQVTQILTTLRGQGTTLVLITHDMDLAATLATHLIVLRQGRVALAGTVREIFCHADFASLSGLDPPPAVQFARRLAAEGADLPDGLIRYSEIRALFAP